VIFEASKPRPCEHCSEPTEMQMWKDEGELSRWVPVCKPQCALDLGLLVIGN